MEMEMEAVHGVTRRGQSWDSWPLGRFAGRVRRSLSYIK